MSVFRLTQHTHERLTQSGSIRDSNENTGYETNRVVAEFDYRQNLHMECGVVAMEPPPPYTIAMKELTQQMESAEREGRGIRSVIRDRTTTDGYVPMASPVNPVIRESPPPYEERERAAGSNRPGNSEDRGRRNSELILLASIPLSDNQLRFGHNAVANRV